LDPEVALLLLQAQPLVHLQVLLLRRPRRRRRLRVRKSCQQLFLIFSLTHITEKEESDEDMGFGLFD